MLAIEIITNTEISAIFEQIDAADVEFSLNSCAYLNTFRSGNLGIREF